MKRTLIIIPTFNERENLESLVSRVMMQDGVELLIVDDNSPDGTGLLADALARGLARLHVLHRSEKAGLGTAYRDGFTWGLNHGFDILVEMDGDGSHQPEELSRILAAMESHDVVIGSRWVDGGKVTDWPWRRMLLSRAGSAYARVALALPFEDITGGFRAYSRDAIRQLELESVASQGYCFQIDMLARAHRVGLDIAEVPITFVERRFGSSKMNHAIIAEAIANVTRWGLQRLGSKLFPERLRRFARQMLMFLAVGSLGFAIDVGVFTVLRVGVLSPASVHGGPILAKLISTSLAILANWAGNRLWTFRSNRHDDVLREGLRFGMASVAGLLVSVGCLWVSHYVLGLTSVVADNVSSNVVGLALGTGLRFVLYRSWVFGADAVAERELLGWRWTRRI